VPATKRTGGTVAISGGPAAVREGRSRRGG
jgi:hypothetical protein